MFSPALEQLAADLQLSGELVAKVPSDMNMRHVKMLWSLPGRTRLLATLEGAGGITDKMWTIILHQLGLAEMRTEVTGPLHALWGVPVERRWVHSLQVTSAIVWVLCVSLPPSLITCPFQVLC